MVIDIKFLNKSDRKAEFIISNIDTSFANAMRRVMMNEIPTMAIEYVDVEEVGEP